MKFILTVCVVIMAINAYSIEVSESLLEKIAKVEVANGDNNAIGDHGKAVGRFQIWRTYVDEVNRISELRKTGTHFNYNDRKDFEKSKEMVRIYLSFWGRQYEKDTKKKATDEVLSKIHNGHVFWKGRKSKDQAFLCKINSYWNKVKNA